MEVVNELIFGGGALLLVAILASVISNRVGAPLLVVFLALGMLAGEDGPGGIFFNDFGLSYLFGSLALAIILFDGGLRTPLSSIKVGWGPAAVLATVGVVVTAALTGLVAYLVLDVAPLAAFLLGAIVASTDAAAVFLLLHQRGMALRRRVQTTLEVESGINDPMAIFLTLTLVELLAAGGGTSIGWDVLETFGRQLGFGVLVGTGGGFALAWLVNRLEMAPGLYPVFVVAGALVVFGGTQQLQGSGFLAVYLAGIIAGNRRLRANQLIRRFHDGIAWVSQIVMFVMLGLLVTPTRLLPDLVPAGLIALGLILLARPFAVAVCLFPFRFTREERLFIAWVGLRGAVPIFLAIIPVLQGIPNSIDYFNLAFLVVLGSLLLQGWTVPWLARRLGIEVPSRPEPGSGKSDFELPSGFDRELIGYRVAETSPVAYKPLDAVKLPPRTRLVAVLRRNVVVPQHMVRQLKPNDYLLTFAPPEQVHLLDKQLLPRNNAKRRRPEVALGDFAFAGGTSMAALADAYDLPVTRQDREKTIDEFLRERMDEDLSVGDEFPLGDVEFVIRELSAEGEIQQVGIWLEPEEPHLLPTWLPRALGGGYRAFRGAGRRVAVLRRPWPRATLSRKPALPAPEPSSRKKE